MARFIIHKPRHLMDSGDKYELFRKDFLRLYAYLLLE